MLAVDQRESLRNMLGRASPGRAINDSALVDFKVQACEALTPYASGVLVDRLYGLPAARVAKSAKQPGIGGQGWLESGSAAA